MLQKEGKVTCSDNYALRMPYFVVNIRFIKSRRKVLLTRQTEARACGENDPTEHLKTIHIQSEGLCRTWSHYHDAQVKRTEREFRLCSGFQGNPL